MILALGAVSLPSYSAIQLSFENGKKFTDYELMGQSRNRSLQTLEKDFNKLFGEVSKSYVADDQKLEIKVTNVDLAGDMRYNASRSGQDVRIVRDNSFIRLYFSFAVKDENDNVIKSGEYKLKEFTNSSDFGRLKERGTVSHFKKPLKKWFEDTFQK